ncbi:hypothetical protein J5J83_10955 [Azoarcus sp. L1K30]|uniref:hypothetical protein n=1 Tax=Azoarcus sp. L1K30 TaxID=2820277 RepID=UPI001B820C77|nr:hypothetical protein [Azoarcus sp. L1K30]MBR0566633.1 hypothetical protein [Azoarcus sp. L1K30]
MSIFDSPIGRCEAVKEMVLLDETQTECAREHACPPGRACPLDGCFTPVSGVSAEHAAAMARAPAKRRSRTR